MLIRWLAIIGIVLAIGVVAWHELPEARKGVSEGGEAIPFTLPDLKG